MAKMVARWGLKNPWAEPVRVRVPLPVSVKTKEEDS